MAHFRNRAAPEIKADGTPVTLADKAAERHIREAIGRQYPGEAILGEEEGGDENAKDRWVIDPIDGTKSFVCGVPLYATLLSYEEGGIPVLGIAYFPALGELAYAERGLGAFLNGRPMRVSQKTALKETVICCASHKGLANAGLNEGVTRLARQVMATRTWCDAYGHMLVADGRVEAMIDPAVQRYDISALQVIVEEAGGTFTDLGGTPNPSLQAVSSNGLLHDTVLESLRA